MDQTTINQFFVARKSSFSSSVPPAKRVKLDGNKVEKNICISSVKARKSKSKHANTKQVATKKKTIKCDQICFGLNDLFDAKALEDIKKPVHDTGITQRGKTAGKKPNSRGIKNPVDGGDINDIFTAQQINKFESVPSLDKGLINEKGHASPLKKTIPRTPQKMHAVEEDIRKPSLNEEINDQAKAILLSRGSAILKAGFVRNQIKSPSKASEILSCLSPQKNYSNRSLTIIGSPSKIQLKSPAKLSDVLKTLTPKKQLQDTESTQNIIQVVSPKQQFDCSKSIIPNRERLRNKFKHLLNRETQVEAKTSSSATNTADLIETTDACSSQDREEMPFKEVKAHEKFQHLARKATSSGFSFPQKFKILIEMFRCVDSILFLLNQRSEICTFQKLKKSVQSMCSRNFELEHLAKLKTVYPNAFTFRQEKGLCASKSYQLTIEANFNKSLTLKSAKITTNVLITRKLQFENNLLVIVKRHHQNFLRRVNMKLSDSEIHRWHPHFNVDEVPDIELSSLPQPPMIKNFKSAADLIRNNRGNLCAKVHDALCDAANKTASTETSSVDSNMSKNISTSTDILAKKATKNANTNSKLKGVSSSILQRIRQKEQNKMQLAMTRDPEKEEKLSKLQRLPEICRILKSYFTTEKKVAILLEDCVQKLSESYGTSVNLRKLEDHVRLLSELVPEWLTIAMVRRFPFVKVVKGYDINKVISTLNNIRNNESET